MKRACTMVAMLVILMAGLMSVCAADENCATDDLAVAAHGCHNIFESKPPVKEAQQDHCGMLCHIAVYSLPQLTSDIPSQTNLPQGLALSTDDTIRLGLYTVLDQPPRA